MVGEILGGSSRQVLQTMLIIKGGLEGLINGSLVMSARDKHRTEIRAAKDWKKTRGRM